MLLHFTVGLSILFLFFIELNVNTFLKTFNNNLERNVEQNIRAQAWRNLQMMEHSIREDMKPFVDKDIPITREMVFRSIDKNGQSYIGSSTGNIFVIDLEDNSLFYNNSIDFDLIKFAGNKHFTEDDLYALTKEKGGDIDSVNLAWNNYLIYKADNPPNDKVSWNVTGKEKWLVCKTLPSTSSGFNKRSSAMQKAFQIKICQTVEKEDILRTYQGLQAELINQKNFLINMIQTLVGLFLLSIIIDFTLKRFKYKNGYDRRQNKFEKCTKTCDIYNHLKVMAEEDIELNNMVVTKMAEEDIEELKI